MSRAAQAASPGGSSSARETARSRRRCAGSCRGLPVAASCARDRERPARREHRRRGRSMAGRAQAGRRSGRPGSRHRARSGEAKRSQRNPISKAETRAPGVACPRALRGAGLTMQAGFRRLAFRVLEGHRPCPCVQRPANAVAMPSASFADRFGPVRRRLGGVWVSGCIDRNVPVLSAAVGGRGPPAATPRPRMRFRNSPRPRHPRPRPP